MNRVRRIVCVGVAAALSLTAIPMRADTPRYHVYLLAGQSNMYGRGDLSSTACDLTNVQIWNGSAWT